MEKLLQHGDSVEVSLSSWVKKNCHVSIGNAVRYAKGKMDICKERAGGHPHVPGATWSDDLHKDTAIEGVLAHANGTLLRADGQLIDQSKVALSEEPVAASPGPVGTLFRKGSSLFDLIVSWADSDTARLHRMPIETLQHCIFCET